MPASFVSGPVRVPKYRRHKPSNQAVVTLGGKDIYLGKWRSSSSREKYRRLVAEWLQTGRASSTSSGDLTVVELIAAYLEHARTYYQKHGRVTAEARLIADALRITRRLYGRTRAADFGPVAYKAVRQEMISRGWVRKHINKQCDRIKRMFKWAAGEELVPPSIYEALRCVPGLKAGRCQAMESEPVLPVPESDVQAVLPHLPEVVCDMVRFQRATGARPNETCIMRPCDVDRTGDVWHYRPGEHKTEHHGRDRLIFIGPKGQEILRQYLLRPADAYCFSPQDSERKRRADQHARRRTPMSCGNRPGSNRSRRPKRPARERYDVDSYRRAIHRACDKAHPPPDPLGPRKGETKKAWLGRLTEKQKEELAQWQAEHRWSPNQLRHSAATEIRRKFGLEAAQVILGHSKADVTQVYAERDYALAARVAAAVG